METNSKDYKRIFIYIFLFCILVYFPVFLDLDFLPIRNWDEARLSINASEMKQNGNFLVPGFDHRPDMWNTKPPLMIWMQVLFLKLIGNGELAVRLPSAIAAFLTCCLILLFSVRFLNSYWFGLIASLILVTSEGYIGIHASRTGDYDAMLTLFTTLYLLAFFLYTETEDRSFLHLFFLGVLLAVMTKSIQALVFIPAAGIYILFQKKFNLFRDKWFYIDLLLVVLVVAGYYLLRESRNPGYLQAVWENELGGRYASTLEAHREKFMFYFNKIVRHHFTAWYWLVPAGLFTGLFIRDEKIKRMTAFIFLCTVFYWLVMSSAKTKLEWYNVPLYPLLSMICAVAIYWIFKAIEGSQYISGMFHKNIIPYIFLFVVMLVPYEKTIKRVFMPDEYDWDKEYYQISYYLKQQVRSEKAPQNCVLCYDGYNAHLKFYLNILSDRGIRAGFSDWKNLSKDDEVIASQPVVKEYIESHYRYDLMNDINGIKTYKIHEPKSE